MIGISYYKNNNNKDALKYFDIVLQNDPNNHLCLKYCAYIYEKKKIFSNTLKMLGKLLSINEEDSLILCYYGETLSKIGKQYIIKKYTQPGITNDFDLYMYNAKGVYFMSNLMNLNYNCQFQGSTNLNSYIIFKAGDNAIFTNRRHKLKHKDILKLEGLGWILYVSFHSVYMTIVYNFQLKQQIEYVQITKDYHKELPKMDHSLPLYTNNIPETFKKKYFLRKETENLLELKVLLIIKRPLFKIYSSILSTLIACLPDESKNLLYNNGIFILTPTSKPLLFNYASFFKALSIYRINMMIVNVLENGLSLISKDKNV
ncbi:hypothetical protein GLOIN_2v1812174 [Rhizophagus irregularis DAOM 181602=DAOM 197198]|nr:hypothetical protein GLOIN_2v1812174 [Rhizophagus irregularis DAOM 181602=DAOM 197198]